jgi:hypothetical protein
MILPTHVNHHQFLTKKGKREASCQAIVSYQTTSTIFNILMHATCTKFNKSLHLASAKQPPGTKRDQTRLLEARPLISIHQPPEKSLTAVPLTTGQTVQSLHPGSHQDALSGATRRQVDSLDLHATIYGCGMHTVPSQQAHSQRGP